MFPLLRDQEIRREQYRDLLRESAFDRLIQQAKGRVRRRMDVARAVRHEPRRPRVWCVPSGLEPACVII